MTYPRPISVEERLTLKARFPDDEDCALCLQSMKGSLVIRLPCGHRYHEKCHARLRGEAASYRYRCPCCRSDIKKQMQRLKVYELWGDDLWDQYQCYVRSLDGGAAPWERASEKRRLEVFERWFLEGLDEEELEELFEPDSSEPAAPPATPPQSSEELDPDEPVEVLDANGNAMEIQSEWIYSEHLEEYLASLTLDSESGDDDSQPDSP